VATSKPMAITVHDLGPLTHTQYFPRNSKFLMERALRFAIKRAHAFVCVSQATADELLEYSRQKYSADLSDRTFVVHEGVSEAFLHPPENLDALWREISSRVREPFILSVGKLSPRKNLEAVIKALRKLEDKIPHHLVTVGGTGWDYREIMDLVQTLGLSDRVHFLGYVSDERLRALYCKASVFVFPSLFEGFGLPVLEAMACGCPVITSNCSSLPEVAGDAAVLVDPHDVDALAAAMEAVCADQGYALELSRKGKERAGLFSWRKTAEEIASIYKRVIAPSLIVGNV